MHYSRSASPTGGNQVDGLPPAPSTSGSKAWNKMARRTGFREQYCTGTRNSYSAGKIGASNQVKLYVGFGRFFIDNFGLTNSFGLGLCMQRDMARRTCFREQYYTGTRKYYCVGKIGASNQVKLCITFGEFFLIFSGLMYSFGLGLFVERDMISLHDWELVRCPGKSMRKILSDAKVIHAQKFSKSGNMKILRFPWFRPSPGSKMSSGEQNRVLTHSIERFTWLEELVSESNTIQAQGNIIGPGILWSFKHEETIYAF